MLFRRLFLCALFVGLCAGLAASLVQRWQVLPLILAAEVFESAAEEAPVAAHDHAAGHEATHDHAAHVHDAAAWQPQDGAERTFWTVVANVAGATGFALLLLPLLALWDHRRGGRGASWRTGLLWGAAGWLALFAWPALGLHPELPGEAAAALDGRQAWWLLAVACAAGGLALAAFGRGGVRALGLPLLALPFLVGAPQAAGAGVRGLLGRRGGATAGAEVAVPRGHRARECGAVGGHRRCSRSARAAVAAAGVAGRRRRTGVAGRAARRRLNAALDRRMAAVTMRACGSAPDAAQPVAAAPVVVVGPLDDDLATVRAQAGIEPARIDRAAECPVVDRLGGRCPEQALQEGVERRQREQQVVAVMLQVAVEGPDRIAQRRLAVQRRQQHALQQQLDQRGGARPPARLRTAPRGLPMRRLPDDPEPAFEVHVFCCVNRRPDSHRRGCCGSRQSEALANYMCRRAMVTAAQRRIRINLSGCLNLCELGPAMVVYPEGVWYHYETEADIEEILDRHVLRGERVQRLLIRDFSRVHR